jgi:hypothetical protein
MTCLWQWKNLYQDEHYLLLYFPVVAIERWNFVIYVGHFVINVTRCPLMFRIIPPKCPYCSI